MIEPKDHIIVGVSGGADSICLLLILLELSKEMDFTLSVVHVNHGIRETAIRDEEFVRQFCKELKVECHLEHAKVHELASEKGISIEEAGRLLRFKAFEKWYHPKHTNKIALAHHKDDQAETVLFHLCRGCGIDGLQGIKPVRGNIIHPLLCVSRKEVEDYLSEIKQSYVTDETNEETIYSRNVIRHEVLPVLEQRVFHQAAEHICETARICLEASDFLKEQMEASLVKYCRTEKEVYYIKEELCEEHIYLQKAIIIEILGQAAGSRKDLEAGHVRDVLGLFAKQTGRQIDLPYGLVALKGYGEIKLFKGIEKKDRDKIVGEEIPIPLNQDTIITLKDGSTLHFRLFPYEKDLEVSQKPYTKWFDYDKIKGCLTVRTRQSGDYLYVSEASRQKLKTYMINSKIPKDERDQILLIAEEDHILWAVGQRISAFYKVDNQTKQILEIKYNYKENFSK